MYKYIYSVDFKNHIIAITNSCVMYVYSTCKNVHLHLINNVYVVLIVHACMFLLSSDTVAKLSGILKNNGVGSNHVLKYKYIYIYMYMYMDIIDHPYHYGYNRPPLPLWI